MDSCARVHSLLKKIGSDIRIAKDAASTVCSALIDLEGAIHSEDDVARITTGELQKRSLKAFRDGSRESAVDYIVSEILDCARAESGIDKKITINAKHLNRAIGGDDELRALALHLPSQAGGEDFSAYIASLLHSLSDGNDRVSISPDGVLLLKAYTLSKGEDILKKASSIAHHCGVKTVREKDVILVLALEGVPKAPHIKPLPSAVTQRVSIPPDARISKGTKDALALALRDELHALLTHILNDHAEYVQKEDIVSSLKALDQSYILPSLGC